MSLLKVDGIGANAASISSIASSCFIHERSAYKFSAGTIFIVKISSGEPTKLTKAAGDIPDEENDSRYSQLNRENNITKNSRKVGE